MKIRLRSQQGQYPAGSEHAVSAVLPGQYYLLDAPMEVRVPIGEAEEVALEPPKFEGAGGLQTPSVMPGGARSTPG